MSDLKRISEFFEAFTEIINNNSIAKKMVGIQSRSEIFQKFQKLVVKDYNYGHTSI